MNWSGTHDFWRKATGSMLQGTGLGRDLNPRLREK